MIHSKRSITAAIAAVGFAVAGVVGSAAQCADYPNKPVRVMIPQPPGGPTDIGVRIYADKLRVPLGQPVVIENRPGAASQIAISQLVKSPADGYMLFYGSNAFASLPFTSKTYDVDWQRDTTPVSIVVLLSSGMAVSTSLNVRNLDELLADVRANPGKRNYGNMGTTDYLTMETFRKTANLPWETIRFNGAAPALQAIQAGDIQITYTTLGTLKPLVDAGKLRVIVVAGNKRSALMPDVPAITEAKDPALRELVNQGFSPNWHGVVGPAKLAADVVDTFYRATAKVAADADFKKRMADIGMDAYGSTPAETVQRMKEDFASWARTAKETNLKPE